MLGMTTLTTSSYKGVATFTNHTHNPATYIGDLLYDEMLSCSIPVAGEHVLVLSFRIPHKIVTRLLTLALCQSSVNVTKVPLLILHRGFGGLQEISNLGSEGDMNHQYHNII